MGHYREAAKINIGHRLASLMPRVKTI